MSLYLYVYSIGISIMDNVNPSLVNRALLTIHLTVKTVGFLVGLQRKY